MGPAVTSRAHRLFEGVAFFKGLVHPLAVTACACFALSACDSGGSGDAGPGSGEPLDESRLDRTAQAEAGGYPGPGDNGYGIELGERVENFTLKNCDKEDVEFAEFFQKRNDSFGDYNRAILLSIGAGWCEPCKEETGELMPEIYEPLHDQGVEIVQVLFQDDAAELPTSQFCEQWRDETFDQVLEFPLLLDQTFDWADDYFVDDPQSATPITLLLDANGNIRWKVVGQNPPDTLEQVQLVLASPYGD